MTPRSFQMQRCEKYREAFKESIWIPHLRTCSKWFSVTGAEKRRGGEKGKACTTSREKTEGEQGLETHLRSREAPTSEAFLKPPGGTGEEAAWRQLASKTASNPTFLHIHSMCVGCNPALQTSHLIPWYKNGACEGWAGTEPSWLCGKCDYQGELWGKNVRDKSQIYYDWDNKLGAKQHKMATKANHKQNSYSRLWSLQLSL